MESEQEVLDREATRAEDYFDDDWGNRFNTGEEFHRQVQEAVVENLTLDGTVMDLYRGIGKIAYIWGWQTRALSGDGEDEIPEDDDAIARRIGSKICGYIRAFESQYLDVAIVQAELARIGWRLEKI